MSIEVPHDCGRTHRGHQSLAECTWPDAAMVLGDGPHAVLSRCDLFTVTLYETAAEARRRLRALDERGCGQACEGHHEVVVLLPEDDVLSRLLLADPRAGRRRRTSSPAR